MARRSSKKFDFGKGIYYFTINEGHNYNITIKRKSKENAVQAFLRYLRTKKDKCEWLGKWDGKKFVESNFEKVAGITSATSS